MHPTLLCLSCILSTTTSALPATRIVARDGAETALEPRTTEIPNYDSWVVSTQGPQCKGNWQPGVVGNIGKNKCYKWTPTPGNNWVSIDNGITGGFDAVLFFTDDDCKHTNGKTMYAHKKDGVHKNTIPFTGSIGETGKNNDKPFWLCIQLKDTTQSFMPLWEPNWDSQNAVTAPPAPKIHARADSNGDASMHLSLYSEPDCKGQTSLHNKNVLYNTAYNSIDDTVAPAQGAETVFSYNIHNTADKDAYLDLYSDATCTTFLGQARYISGKEKGCSPIAYLKVNCVKITKGS